MLINKKEKNTRQMLENVYRVHLVLVSGKLIVQQKQNFKKYDGIFCVSHSSPNKMMINSRYDLIQVKTLWWEIFQESSNLATKANNLKAMHFEIFGLHLNRTIYFENLIHILNNHQCWNLKTRYFDPNW